MRILSKVLPILLVLFFVVLYVGNLSRSVYGGDVGDFVTAAAVGGVAHPPGYPLFVLLGFILIRLLPFFTPAFAVGLISAFAGVAGVYVVYTTTEEVTGNKLTGLITALFLGTSYLYWFYSEIAEVFALNSFFVILLFFLAIKFDKTKKPLWFILLFFVFGLSLMNHQIIVLFFPSLVCIMLPQFLRMKQKKTVLLKSFLLTLSSGLLYIYVFIASSHHPVVNWDYVHDLGSFLRLVLRLDYGTFHAGIFPQPVFAQRVVIVKTYLLSVISQTTIPVVCLALLGLFGLFKDKKQHYAIAYLLGFLISGPLFIAYAGFPLEGSFFLGVYERFFTMSTIPLILASGYGLYTLSLWFVKTFNRKLYFFVFQIIFLLVPLQLFFFNIQKCDLSQVFTGDLLGADFLTPLPHGSVLLLSGDTSLFNTWYMHYARHVRPDIHLVNFSQITLDSFMHSQEAKLKNRSAKPPTGNELIIQTLAFMSKNGTPVYSYDNLETPGKTVLYWVPSGLLYRLYPNATPPPESIFLSTNKHVLSEVHLPLSTQKNYNNLTIAEIPQIYSKSIWSIGNYVKSSYHDANEALFYYNLALKVDPTYENAYETAGLIYLANKNMCQMSVYYFKQALETTPYDELPYFLLYTSYTECFRSTKDAKVVTQAFSKEFHKNFYSELLLELREIKK